MTEAQYSRDTSIRFVWRAFLVEGIILALLGAGAILAPSVASITATLLLGWLFVAGGAVGLLTTLFGRQAPGYWWSLASSLITLGAGGFLLFRPIAGVVSLTLVLSAYLAADGVISILIAIAHARRHTPRWSLLLMSGLVDLALAALIFTILKAGTYSVLGLLIGVDFLSGGAALIAIALAARHPLPERD
jgi:uncharacterized membrane protein HdeD (DUF308 family)